MARKRNTERRGGRREVRDAGLSAQYANASARAHNRRVSTQLALESLPRAPREQNRENREERRTEQRRGETKRCSLDTLLSRAHLSRCSRSRSRVSLQPVVELPAGAPRTLHFSSSLSSLLSLSSSLIDPRDRWIDRVESSDRLPVL